MSTSLTDVADVIRSDRIMTGANLVGKSVFAQTGRISTDGETASSIEFELPYGADQVEIGIYDPVSGTLMRSIVVGPQSSGTLNLKWDGRLADGTAAQPGSYIIRGNVVVAGQTEVTTPSTYSRVETVSWDALNSDLTLNLTGGSVIPMAQVSRIGQEAGAPSATTSATVNSGE